jgi:hypothetical protein
MTPGSLPNHKGLGGPFKPSFGLSGVVADPIRRSLCHPERSRELALSEVEGICSSADHSWKCALALKHG